MAEGNLRCFWCYEPWTVHTGHPVTVGGELVRQRPQCDCYREVHPEHAGPPLALSADGVALPVTGLRAEHHPTFTAQELRARDDEAIERLQAAAAAAQAAIEQAVADKNADRFAALAAALKGVLVAAGQPVPPELEKALE